MATLAELERAVEQLPLAEQEELLRHVSTRVRQLRAGADAARLEQWMSRLDALRAAIGTGRTSLSAEHLLDELREERG